MKDLFSDIYNQSDEPKSPLQGVGVTDLRNQINSLRHELEQHNYNYYVLNNPTISDFEFDMKMKQLEELEKEHPEFFDPNSPTQRVGSDVISSFKQVKHQYPMLSLSNTYSEGEVNESSNEREKH